jgi:hypothetical protein
VAKKVYELRLEEAKKIKEEMEVRDCVLINHPDFGLLSYGQIAGGIKMLEDNKKPQTPPPITPKP